MQGLKDTVASVLEGFNATILAYGQTVSKGRPVRTHAWLHASSYQPAARIPARPCPCALQGSGKTHTLLGDVSSPTERGVVPRAVAELAQGMARYPECRFKVWLGVGRAGVGAGRLQGVRQGGPAGMPDAFTPSTCHGFHTLSCLQVTLSVIEIYNERIKDLLDPSKDNLQAGGWEGGGGGRGAMHGAGGGRAGPAAGQQCKLHSCNRAAQWPWSL